MKGEEVRLMKEYRKLERDFEDFLMTDINDMISKFVDEKGIEKYDMTLKICKETDNTINKVSDYNSLEFNMDKFIEKINKFYDDTNKIADYFISPNELASEVLDAIKSKVDSKMIKISELQFGCAKIGYQKISRNIKFGEIKLRKTMSNLLTEIVLSSIREYRTLVVEEIVNMDTKIKEKINDIQSYESSEIIKEHKKLQKILNCDKMDAILKSLGFKPIRQNSSSHLIYSNGVKSIPVPQHTTLNKNLGYTIQKQISN